MSTEIINKKISSIAADNMTAEQFNYICSMVNKINSSASDIFKNSVDKRLLRYCYIFSEEENLGVMTAIETEKYISIQICFEKDVEDMSHLQHMHEVVNKLIDTREDKELYLNVYGYNVVIINYFRNYGFVQSAYGYGFEFTLTSSEQKLSELKSYRLDDELEIRGFEDSHSRDYLDLLEDAFMEQSTLCHEKTAVGDDYAIDLKEMDSRGGFGALWQGDNLIGLYSLNGNYIDHIAVLTKYKGRGYGDKLLKYCLRYLLVDKNYTECTLCTYKINYKAQKLYLKNGFKVTSFYCENEYANIQV